MRSALIGAAALVGLHTLAVVMIEREGGESVMMYLAIEYPILPLLERVPYAHPWDVIIFGTAFYCIAGAVIGVFLHYVRQQIRRASSRRAHRCRSCGYDLRFLESTRCPECGQPFGEEVTRARAEQRTLYPLIIALCILFFLLFNLAMWLVSWPARVISAQMEAIGFMATLIDGLFLCASVPVVVRSLRGDIRSEPILIVLAVCGAVVSLVAIPLHWVFETSALVHFVEALVANANWGLFGVIVFSLAAKYYWRRERRDAPADRTAT